MTTRFGTSYFVNRDAAIDYYAAYCTDGYTSRFHGGQIHNRAATASLVDQKLADREIHLGKPQVIAGEKATFNRQEGRYFIETK